MHFFAILIFLCGFLVSGNESKPSSRIIGGEPAYINQYSFAAAINVQTNTSRYFCGGSLFQNRWILTAGQCVYGATLFTIQLGSARLNEDDPNRLTLASSEYIVHPRFNPQTLENDIGLIKLRMMVEYSDYIRPVSPLAMYEVQPSASLRILGWGQTTDQNSSLSDHLQVVRVTSLSNSECKLVYGNQIADSMLCVEGNYNEGSCHGDTGSALLDTFSKYTAIHSGIASFVSSNGCESTDPSGYTRTYPFVTWIYQVTRSG